jgi:ABC-type Fe3+ transport system substrate-binding protein
MSDNNNLIPNEDLSNAPGKPDKKNISRRHFVAGATALVAGVGVTKAITSIKPAAAASVASTNTLSSKLTEDQILDQLYKAALAEGGDLVVYGGGDALHFYDATKAAFAARFPGINLTIKVDLSKYHDGAIDNQLIRNQLEPDVAYLQTIQDFHRWKKQGQLLPYRDAIGLKYVYPTLKDPDGTFVALGAVSFNNVVNTNIIPASQAPRDPLDYLAPSLKNQLVFLYPNDDDAALFTFKLIIDKYGWGYMDKLLAQNPLFIRGLVPVLNVVGSGQKAATFTGVWNFADKASGVVWLPPKHDHFMSFGETAAIFKKAKHPAAGKLFISWSLSTAIQQTAGMWPVRTDVPVQGGYLPLSSYNTNPEDFTNFMIDRADAEIFRSQFHSYIGEPVGPDPALS